MTSVERKIDMFQKWQVNILLSAAETSDLSTHIDNMYLWKNMRKAQKRFFVRFYLHRQKIDAKSGYGAFYSIIMHSESLQRVYIEMSTMNHIYKQLSNYIDCSFRYWWENDCKGCNILWRVTWFMRLQSK